MFATLAQIDRTGLPGAIDQPPACPATGWPPRLFRIVAVLSLLVFLVTAAGSLAGLDWLNHLRDGMPNVGPWVEVPNILAALSFLAPRRFLGGSVRIGGIAIGLGGLICLLDPYNHWMRFLESSGHVYMPGQTSALFMLLAAAAMVAADQRGRFASVTLLFGSVHFVLLTAAYIAPVVAWMVIGEDAAHRITPPWHAMGSLATGPLAIFVQRRDWVFRRGLSMSVAKWFAILVVPSTVLVMIVAVVIGTVLRVPNQTPVAILTAVASLLLMVDLAAILMVKYVVHRLEDGLVEARGRADALNQMHEMAQLAAGAAGWAYDFQARTFVASECMNNLFGLPPKTVWDMDRFDRLCVSAGHGLKELVDQVADRGDGVMENRIHRADGSIRWVQNTARRTLSNGRSFAYGLVIDITDRKEAELERCRAEGEAQRACAEVDAARIARSRLLSDAAHKLSQPVQALGMEMMWLESDPSPERIEKIQQSIKRLTAITHAFNTLSGAERAAPSEPVTLARMMDEIRSTYMPVARRTSVDLTIMPTSLWVNTDMIILKQIVQALVDNAVKFSPMSKVLVGAKRDGGNVRITVVDGGCGISADRQAHIFDGFLRPLRNFPGSGAPIDKYDGIGVSLAIAILRAGLIGATLEFSSVEDEGSVFEVVLPRAEPVAMASEVRVSAVQNVVSSPIPRMVVVIEDDDAVRESIVEFLESEKCDVIAAASVDDALTAMSSQRGVPDIIIADYRLGNGGQETGVDSIERIRSVNMHFPIPAILLTAAPEASSDPGLGSGHGIALLCKPVFPADLRAAIDDVLLNAPWVAGL